MERPRTGRTWRRDPVLGDVQPGAHVVRQPDVAHSTVSVYFDFQGNNHGWVDYAEVLEGIGTPSCWYRLKRCS